MPDASPITETVCTSCGHTTERAAPSRFCPHCGEETPWEERPAHVFDEDDLPFVFSHQVYDDHSELWRSFCSQYFGVAEVTGTDVAGLPEDFPQLQYCVVDLWYRITPSHELEGPFLSQQEARNA